MLMTKCNEHKSKPLQYPVTQVCFIYGQHANDTSSGYDRKISRYAYKRSRRYLYYSFNLRGCKQIQRKQTINIMQLLSKHEPLLWRFYQKLVIWSSHYWFLENVGYIYWTMCRRNILHQNYEINYVVRKWSKLFDTTFETLFLFKLSTNVLIVFFMK